MNTIDTLQIRLFGGVFLEVMGQPVTTLKTQKEALLLAYLALTPYPHGRGSLAALLWDDPVEEREQQQIASNFRTLLSRLRKNLGDYLHVTRQTVAINPAYVMVDVVQFEQVMEEARTAWPADEAIALLDSALGLVHGEFLAGMPIKNPDLESWHQLTAERLREQRLWAHRKLAEHALSHRQYRLGINHGHALVTLDPLHEEGHRLLMCLLARDGQRTAALQQYNACAAILDTELGVDPTPETQQLAHRLRTAANHTLHNLPQIPTSFVGQGHLLAQIDEGLRQPQKQGSHGRIVTILGMGGAGKTRLAIEAAQLYLAEYLHGVAFISLERIHQARELPLLLGQQLGLHLAATKPVEIAQQLWDYLYNRELLLILDNLEPLLGDPQTVAFIQTLIGKAPHVSLLITSREPLRLQAEWLVRVAGLSFPPPAAFEVEATLRDWQAAVRQYDALDLFQQRATQQGIQLAGEALPSAAETCRLVEGLPLAIELITALLADYPLAKINQFLRDRLAKVKAPFHDRPERHHSLHAVFDYSWQLLSEAERTGLARLSILRTPFAKEAATAVADVNTAVLTTLTRKSLLHIDQTSGRYRLHPLIRQFMSEKRAVEPAVFSRHATYFLELVAAQTPHLYGPDMPTALDQVRHTFEDVRLAWQTAVHEKRLSLLIPSLKPLHAFAALLGWQLAWVDMLAEAAAQWVTVAPFNLLLSEARLGQVANHLVDEPLQQAFNSLPEADQFWHGYAQLVAARTTRAQGHFSEAEAHSQQAITQLAALPDEPAVADAYLQLGHACVEQGNHAEATKAFELAQIHYQKYNQPYKEAAVWQALGLQAYIQGQAATSMAHYEKALALQRQYGSRLSLSGLLNKMGLVSNQLRQYDDARAYYEEALAIERKVGQRDAEGDVLHNLGLLAQHERHFEQARAYYQQSLLVTKRVANPRNIAITTGNLGDVAFFLGDYARAAQQYAEGLAMREALGDERGMAWSLCCNATTANVLGHYQRGEAWAERAIDLAEKLGDKPYLASALTYWGDALLAREDVDTAVSAYQRVLDIRRQLGLPFPTLVPLMRLGQVALAQEELDTAVSYVEAFTPLLEESALGELFTSGQAAVLAYRVWMNVGEQARAQQIWEAAHRELHIVAQRITEGAMRHKFLHNVQTHRQLLLLHP